MKQFIPKNVSDRFSLWSQYQISLVAVAMWGPVAFLWIVLGTLFAGGVHDYFSGMLSVKHKGESITEISGYYLGSNVKQFMRLFSVVLLIMVGRYLL